MKEFRKRLWLYASFLSLIHSPIAYTADDLEEDAIAANWKSQDTDVEKDTYTINFNQISMVEFIRFASKITNLNFVFDNADLQFNVTVVSEEAVNAQNVMAALSQVLRMHELTLIEQDGNVLITKSKAVNQIPTVISSDIPSNKVGNSALVTRVFKIKNINVNSAASLIRPMISQGALIEAATETSQLIVTDIPTSIDQIASLLMTIDTTHSPLDIESYTVKNIAPVDLIGLTRQILSPFTEGSPLIFVPQVDTNSIYIVSTPHLIERAMTVMEDLDLPPKPQIAPSGAAKNVFIYRPIYRMPQDLMAELKQVDKQLKSVGGPLTPLETSIESVKEIKETGSLMFIVDPETTSKLKDILSSLDTIPSKLAYAGAAPKSNFLIYNPKYRSGEDLYIELNDVERNLITSGLADPDLLGALDSMKWVPNINSLIFTGSPQAIQRVQGMLQMMDTAASAALLAREVFIYTPHYVSSEQIEHALHSLIPSLQQSHLASDRSLIEAIQSMQWNKENQSFVFTSDPATIERLKGLLAKIDAPEKAPSAKGFYLYKLQYVPCDTVKQELQNIAKRLSTNSLENQNLMHAINKLECIKANNALLITGTNEAIDQIKTLIAEFDVPTGVAVPSLAQNFFIYKAKFIPASEIEVALNDLAADLKASGLNDPELFQSISSMRYVDATDSLLFTGSPDALAKVQNLIGEIDTNTALGAIREIGGVTFFLYKIQLAAADKLMAALKTFAQSLKATEADKKLSDAINTMKYISESNSILFTGDAETLSRLEPIIQQFDNASLAGPAPTPRAVTTFIIYNPKYLAGEDLISILKDFMQNLEASGVSDPGLYDTVNNLKWIPKTNSLLISGDVASVDKVQQLLTKFDVPNKEAPPPSIESIDNTSFLVYKLQYHPGNDIQSALKQVAIALEKGSAPPSALVDAINSIQWVMVTNSLLVTGQQDVLVKLKELIQNLDAPLRQVFIEVLIIQTSLTNTQNFGLMWGSQAQFFSKATMGTGNFPTATNPSGQITTPVGTFAPNLQSINATTTPLGGIPSGMVPFTSGFDLGAIGDIIMNKGRSFISIGALVNAIQSDSDSTIIINPKLITQDNRQSTIFVGENVPYTGSIVQNAAANTTTTSNIEYRDVGVSLTITPILGENDIITLDIVNDISQVISAASSTNSLVLTGIETSHAHMETRVAVPNNHFVALSGMIDDSKTHYKTGIPCLGGLPVIGALFSENDRTANKSSIIIFMRPQIINTYDEYKALTEHQEWLYKYDARLPVLKEQFDEGIDLVKTPENE